MSELLGNLCFVDIATMTPEEYGVPQHRERQYTIMRHKIKSAILRDALNRLLERLNRQAALMRVACC